LDVCLEFEAVNPPPDGAYPNFTTAEGQKALFSLTTGSANTAVGWYSLFSDAAGNFNTATGAGAKKPGGGRVLGPSQITSVELCEISLS